MTDKRELANELMGFILGKLYDNFPNPMDFDYEIAAKDPKFIDQENIVLDIFDNTVIWLHKSQFIYIFDRTSNLDGSACAFFDVTLTEKSLVALDKIPPALGMSVGKKLANAAKDAGAEAGKSVLSEQVGNLLAGVIKGFMV